MQSTQEDVNSRFKLAQLRHLIAHPSFMSKTNSNIIALVRAVNELLTDDVNINYKVTINPYREKWKIHLKDCTALHFSASDKHDIDAFNILLVRGADFTIKNENGQTALHLVTTNYLNRLKKFSTVKNRNAPIKFPVTSIFSIKDPKINHNSFINSVLSAHVKFQNSVNPRDNNGLSHLHAACIANHVKALELFLENGASVDEAVNFDAPQFAGYTPLHFTVTFHSFKATEMLMSRGANINARTVEGLTPLDILVKHLLDNYGDLLPDDSKQTFQNEILRNEKIIKLLLEKQSIPNIGLSSLHVTCTLKDLTTAELLLDQGADVDYAVPIDSSLCPGNTALHFAAYNSIEAVKMLMKRGAKLDVTNAKGFTPLDICADKYSLQEIWGIVSCDKNWKTIRMTDDKTSLLNFVKVSAELLQFKVFLQNNMQNMTVPSDSLILPGCTMLHLAVVFSTKKKGENKYDDSIVKECLKIGLDVNTPNARGQTPIHLAFRLNKDNIVELLLQDLDKLDQLVDLVDEDDLSYFLITCAMENEALVKKLLQTSTPNVAYKGRPILMGIIEPGTTPLHVAAAYGSQPMVEMLLKHGADLHAADANGMTPIHYLLQLEGPRIDIDVVKILFNALLENPRDCVAHQLGLTYLHIACYVGHAEAVKKLLNIGSNVNAVISYQNSSDERNLSRQQLRLLDFPMCTPLHLANYRPVVEIIELLMRRGADVFAAATKYSVRHIRPLKSRILLENKDITRIFISVLWEESELQKRMEERWGLTRLHIACHMKNEEAIKSLLNDGIIDVNSQMHADAEVFAGCTPLHLLLTVSSCYIFEYYHYRQTYSFESMVRLLLDHGADVTIANAKKNTPVHLLSRASSTYGIPCAETLLNAQKDFGVNPANARGESHFHIACKWLFIEVIEKFLQHGAVEVNQRNDLFARRGETPLHYTCWQDVRNVDWAKFSQTIDMLFAHGADPTVKDIHGDTPLHKPGLTRAPNAIEVMDKFIRHGADIKSENISGQTILDKWNILNPMMDYGSLFIKYSYPINSWNNVTGEGYIAKIFLSQIHRKVERNAHFQKLMQSPDVRSVDKLGRTVIHNSVAVLPPKYQGVENYIYAIECFISQGVDIDHQDQSGQTALHYAVQMENEMGVEALLKFGTDINIIDANGMPAFFYCTEYSKGEEAFSGAKKIVNKLKCHVKKLQHLNLEVNQTNENLAASPQLIRCRVLGDIRDEDPNTVLQPFFSQVEMAKTVDVGVRSLTFFDFLNETGGVTLYPYLLISERTIIDEFFKSIASEKFSDLIGIIKLQFRKMKARLALIDSALISLRKLLGFSFPGLCEEISRYLTNSDLKNLTACTDDMR